MPPADRTPRYRAFLSYSHADIRLVRWLHRTLEGFRLPRKLVGEPTPLGPAPRRLIPIFRDRDELPAAGDLSSELRAALSRSLRLVVICSPAAARSSWVNEEILTFKRLHGEGGVLALIVSGEPGAADKGQECFPPALRFVMGADGRLTDQPAHPIAADMRAEGDGRRGALLKLIAGLAGVRLDELVQREAQRRMQSVSTIAAAAMVGMASMAGLALYANQRREEADRESAAARAASDFLVGTFALTNPATENPRTISALSILQRAGERSARELKDQPLIRMRLLETLGRAYNNLGLFADAEAAGDAALPAMLATGPEGAGPMLSLAVSYKQQGKLDEASRTVQAAERLLGPDRRAFPERRADAAEIYSQIDAAESHSRDALREDDIALADYARAPNVKPEKIARVYVNHGLTLAELGRHDEARQSLKKGLGLYRRALGDDDRLVGQTYNLMARNEIGAKNFREAQAYTTRSIDILSKVLDNDNPLLAEVISARGEIYLQTHQPQAARADFLRAIDIFQRAYRGPHYMTGASQVFLGLADSELGNTDAALRDLVLAKANYDGSYRRLNVNHGDLLVNRAVILKRAGRLAEARRNCSDGLAILKRLLPPDDEFYKSNVAICAGI